MQPNQIYARTGWGSRAIPASDEERRPKMHKPSSRKRAMEAKTPQCGEEARCCSQATWGNYANPCGRVRFTKPTNGDHHSSTKPATLSKKAPAETNSRVWIPPKLLHQTLPPYECSHTVAEMFTHLGKQTTISMIQETDDAPHS